MSTETDHLTVTVADLREAAVRMAAACAERHEAIRAHLDADLAVAARNKSGMADGYWKPVHAARLKALAASAVLAALMEVTEECRPLAAP